MAAIAGYDEAGEGPAVVLLRAALGDRRMREARFTALAADHRVIRYDRRGFGESADGHGESARREDLPALLDARGIEQAGGRWAGGGAGHRAGRAGADHPAGTARLGPERPHLPGPRAGRLRRAGRPGRLARYRAQEADVDPAHVTAMSAANTGHLVAGLRRDTAVLPPDLPALARERCEQVSRREWTAPQWTERPAEATALLRKSG
jgi:pimeloyl-ACP methyl ester carboxylesterase